MDRLEWTWCLSCGAKEASSDLFSDPRDCVARILQKRGLSDSDASCAAAIVEKVYGRKVSDRFGNSVRIDENDIDVAWKAIRSVLPDIRDGATNSSHIDPKQKTSVEQVENLIMDETDLALDSSGEWNMYIEWPLRALEAMGWIGRDQTNVWRLI